MIYIIFGSVSLLIFPEYSQFSFSKEEMAFGTEILKYSNFPIFLNKTVNYQTKKEDLAITRWLWIGKRKNVLVQNFFARRLQICFFFACMF